MVSYKVAGIYHTGEETCDEEFSELEDAKAYYEKLIVELGEDYEDVASVIDWITIHTIDENGEYGYNIETYTYDS